MSDKDQESRQMDESVFGCVKCGGGCVLVLFTRRKPAPTTQSRTTMAQQKGGGVFVVENAIIKGIFRKTVVITLRDENYECRDVIMENCSNPNRVAEFIGLVAFERANCGSRSFVPEVCWGSVMPDSFIAG